jgi:hypothetical protein
VGAVVDGFHFCVPVCDAECTLSLDPLKPEVHASPVIDATAPGAEVCTGTHHPLATGTVTAKSSGGLIISAEVSASLTFTLLEQYDFACDYAMWAGASGSYGFLRHVHMKVRNAGVDVVAGAGCDYDGVQRESCEANSPFLRDAFSGAGVAGPGGVELPTEVTICPSSESDFQELAYNDGYQDLPFTGVMESGFWSCKTFGIHYQ